MKEPGVLDVLEKVGAVIRNSHIVYTSGKHGSEYVNKDLVYLHTKKISLLCKTLARQFRDDKVEVVIAPAIGGVILSQWTAYHLSDMNDCNVLSVYAEKEIVPIPDPEGKNRQCFVETGCFSIKREYDKVVSGKRVLVVEDVLTTGGSARKVVITTRAVGGEVVGLGVLCNRGGVAPQDVANVPKLIALVNVNLDAYDETDCPLCKRGVPINTEVGGGREFLLRQELKQ